jgi:hypothetical protein
MIHGPILAGERRIWEDHNREDHDRTDTGPVMNR